MSVYVCICQISNVSAAVSQMELCTIPSGVKTHFPLHTCLLPKFQNSKCWVLHSDRCGTPCKYSAWNLPAIIKMSPLHHSCSWIFGFDAMVGITRSKVIFFWVLVDTFRGWRFASAEAHSCAVTWWWFMLPAASNFHIFHNQASYRLRQNW